MSIKLLVADDHEVVRLGLVSLFAGTDIKVVGEVKTGAEAVKAVSKLKPDVLLLDVRMVDVDGLDALEKLRRQLSHLKVVMYSGYNNPTYIARAHALGATDFILKGAPRADLISAIQAAVAGHGPIRAGEMRRVAHMMSSPAEAKHDLPLTPREMQVIRHLAMGLSNKEIAHSLEISVETVKEHVQNLLRKLGLTDRTQAAVLAVRKGVA